MKGHIRSKVADSGRVVIPAELRREYGIEDGQDIVFARGEDGIELLTVPQVVRRVQDTVRQYIPDDKLDLTSELLELRKQDGSLA